MVEDKGGISLENIRDTFGGKNAVMIGSVRVGILVGIHDMRRDLEDVDAYLEAYRPKHERLRPQISNISVSNRASFNVAHL